MYSKLWDYQKSAADIALSRKSTALFLDQGTGKTFLTAGIIDRLLTPTFSGLVVVPGSTIRPKNGWLDVLGRLGITVTTNPAIFKKSRGSRILLLSYEGFCPRRTKRNPRGSQTFVRWITTFPWSLVVFDESQKLKARGSRQSRTAGRIKNAEKRLILTGTPFDDLLQNPQEAWAQWRFLDPNLFGTRWFDYDNEYLLPTGWKGYKRKFKPGAKKKLLKKLKPYCVRVSRDVLGLEPVKYVRCPVILKPGQRLVYNDMEKDLVVNLGSSLSTAELKVTQIIRLHQVCGGFIKDDEGEEHKIGSSKLLRLKNLLERVPRPVVIFCRYLWEVDQIESLCLSANERVSTITGKSRDTRTETINRFQNGKIDVLVSQIRTGGVGINLHRANIGIFYSTTYSYIDFDQAVSRLHRAGQQKKVKIFLLLVKDSIDEEIYNAVLYKRSATELILRRFHRKEISNG